MQRLACHGSVLICLIIFKWINMKKKDQNKEKKEIKEGKKEEMAHRYTSIVTDDDDEHRTSSSNNNGTMINFSSRYITMRSCEASTLVLQNI